MKTRPSEQRYRCAASLDIPKDLPRLEGTEAAVDLSIVIPAFNEVPRLPVMLKQAVEHLSSPSSRGRTVEIIVVDDGSSDGTSDMALKLAEEHKEFDIRVVSLEKNLGKGGAVRHGMLHARGGRLLMVDADGASQFEDVDKLWLEMDRLSERTDAAVVIGSRAHLVKTDAVVKVRPMPPVNVAGRMKSLFSVRCSETWQCTRCTSCFNSSGSAIFEILNADLNYSRVALLSRSFPTSTLPVGFLT